MSRILGIDPGKTGAMCFMTDDEVIPMLFPLAGKELDLWLISEFVKAQLPIDLAVIEKVGAMPGQGVTSMFTFGLATGMLHGIVAGLGIPRQAVTPQRWKKIVLSGTPKDKDAAIAYCRRKYPDVSLLPTPRSKVNNHNLADAICIAEYGRILHANQLV